VKSKARNQNFDTLSAALVPDLLACVLFFAVVKTEPEGEIMNLEPITKEIRQEITKLNHILKALEGAKGIKETKVSSAGPRRKMSAAGRKRIAAAQRARWAKIKAAGKK